MWVRASCPWYCLIKEIIPNSPESDRQFLQYSSLLKSQQLQELLDTELV